jgi:hypothetical protein
MEDTKDQDAIMSWGFEAKVLFVWNESRFAVKKMTNATRGLDGCNKM